MATKSILKNIYVKDFRGAQKLVNALENASGKKSQHVDMRRTSKELDKSEIQKLFGGSNGGV